jgi:hypothetical protein
MPINVRSDGFWFQGASYSAEYSLGGDFATCRIDPVTGDCTIRIPASQCNVEAIPVQSEQINLTNDEITRIAVKYSGVTIAEVETMNPTLAAQLISEEVPEGNLP